MQEGKLVKLIFKSRLMPSQPKEKSGRPFVSLILTVCKESPKARIDYKLVPQETGSYQELSWSMWWWTWARLWPRRSASAWSRSTRCFLVIFHITHGADWFFLHLFSGSRQRRGRSNQLRRILRYDEQVSPIKFLRHSALCVEYVSPPEHCDCNTGLDSIHNSICIYTL